MGVRSQSSEPSISEQIHVSSLRPAHKDKTPKCAIDTNVYLYKTYNLYSFIGGWTPVFVSIIRDGKTIISRAIYNTGDRLLAQSYVDVFYPLSNKLLCRRSFPAMRSNKPRESSKSNYNILLPVANVAVVGSTGINELNPSYFYCPQKKLYISFSEKKKKKEKIKKYSGKNRHERTSVVRRNQ